VAEIGEIKIHEQYLVFGVFLLNFSDAKKFEHFSAQGLLARGEHLFGQLLGQG
jgi:hypothetical protein